MPLIKLILLMIKLIVSVVGVATEAVQTLVCRRKEKR